MSVLLLDVDLGERVGAWFTGRDPDRPRPPVGVAGNLSHRRPHQPAVLADTRAEVGRRIGFAPATWVTMHQVHGAEVAVVDGDTPAGAELRGVDALVTAQPGRPLAVAVADCVPVLLAGAGAVAAVHAGRRGVQDGVVAAALDTLAGLGAGPETVRAAVGPAIGGCCYEVPEPMHAEVVANEPAADATTTWGTPALDLPAAVDAQLRAAGVPTVRRTDGCTRCDPQQRWFSHRSDPGTGRQFGLVVCAGATS
ncbi:polyphenol oxidase family protein [Egicoccus sp. AB-alg6-2]|uniref:polyphenol oxidase family protein n=1 Tax=Egicoccus sp. AB-alg6-2 TaxID=3242692 RepID=UPI00359E5929